MARFDPYDPGSVKLEDNNWELGQPYLYPKERRNPVEPSGARILIASGLSRLQIFLLFCNDTVFRNIIESTNHLLRESSVKGTRRLLEEPELRIFIAIKLFMRVVHFRRLEDYFRSFHENDPVDSRWAGERMSYRRFVALNSHLHAHVERLLAQIVSNSLAVRHPARLLSFDESRVLYEGRDCNFIVRMPDKPIVDGLLIYTLCDSRSYNYGAALYTGVSRAGCVFEYFVFALCAQAARFLPRYYHREPCMFPSPAPFGENAD